jgi:hypothetical protein
VLEVSLTTHRVESHHNKGEKSGTETYQRKGQH